MGEQSIWKIKAPMNDLHTLAMGTSLCSRLLAIHFQLLFSFPSTYSTMPAGTSRVGRAMAYIFYTHSSVSVERDNTIKT